MGILADMAAKMQILGKLISRFRQVEDDSGAYAYKALVTGSGGREFQDDRNFLIFDENVEILRRFDRALYIALI